MHSHADAQMAAPGAFHFAQGFHVAMRRAFGHRQAVIATEGDRFTVSFHHAAFTACETPDQHQRPQASREGEFRIG